MDSPGTRTPLKSITPRPIVESEVSFAVQLDKLPDGQYAQPRSAMTEATVVVPPPTESPIHPTVLPMRPVPDARYTSTESRTYVEQDFAVEQRFSSQQRFPDERYLGQKYAEQIVFPEQRFSEQKHYSEQRFPDQRYTDQRYPDQRHPDQRHPDQRHPDQRYPDQRYPDQRYPDQRYPDQRYTEQRYTEQRFSQQQQHPDHRFQHDGRPPAEQQNRPSQQYPDPGYPGPHLGSTAPPTSTSDYPPRPLSMQLAAPNFPLDVRSVKANCYHQLQEVIRLRRQRHGFLGASSGGGSGRGELEWQIRNQTGMLLGQLKMLQAEVRKLAKGAQNHRWRRWIIGGFIATFIPFIRRLFRRGTDLESMSSSNNTEYAFRKSKSLISRIKENVLRHGHWASMAFFVFSVLFIFSNEVVFRVSKTIYKRIRKLVARIEHCNDDVTEKDLKILEGWRWRVMLW